MKKIIFLLTAVIIVATAAAQVKIAAKGGWNYSTARTVYSSIKQHTGYTSGYGAGVMVKIPFDGLLHFSPSVMVNKRGFIVEPAAGFYKKEQYSITYLDIMPSLSIDIPVKNNAIAFSFGPDFGFTKFGKVKATDVNNVTSSQKLKFGYEQYGWFDLGLTAGIGYHTKKMLVEVGYIHGLASINNNEENDQRNIRNRMLSLNVGYYFR